MSTVFLRTPAGRTPRRGNAGAPAGVCVCFQSLELQWPHDRRTLNTHTHTHGTQPAVCAHTLAAQRRFPASSPDGAGVASAGGEAGLDVVVVTLVLVLLLAPNQVCVDELVDFSLHQIEGEWRELQGHGKDGKAREILTASLETHL